MYVTKEETLLSKQINPVGHVHHIYREITRKACYSFRIFKAKSD